MARQGFMIYHDDAVMLLSADDETIGKFFRGLAEFSMSFVETGEIPREVPFEGMARGLYLSMRNKIIRDHDHYNDTIKNNTIKGIISAIQAEYKASTGKKLKPEEARMIAEQRYAKANSGQLQSTAVDSSELTVAERSEAEAVSGTVDETFSVTSAVSVAETGLAAVPRPTKEEIIEHLQKAHWVPEHESDLCASSFIEYETAHNWMYGNQQVRDWKAVLWEFISHPDIWKQ